MVTDARKRLFLYKLAELIEDFQVGIFYTNDDDGVHITIGEEEEEVFLGSVNLISLTAEEEAQKIRDEADRKYGNDQTQE